MSYDDVMSQGWFLVELEKWKNGDKNAFQPDPKDIWAYYQAHASEFNNPS